MKQRSPPFDLPAEPLCLFLDVDGTLLEFASTPEGVTVSEELESLLERAAAGVGGALALVSGRSLQQLDRIFAPRRWPAAGLHGLERRDAEGRVHYPVSAGPDLQEAREVMEQLSYRAPGLILEDKGATLALHYRQAPSMEDELRAEMESLLGRLGDAYHLQPGSHVLELKPAGYSKARAIDDFLDEAPFAGRTPVFAGDDLTDLDGFEAVERHGGVSISVGDRVSGMIRLADPSAFHKYLAELTHRMENTT
jgi:trehalose 6-phosphate phosphatase